MFGCFSIGQILRIVRITDKIRPHCQQITIDHPFENLSQRDHFLEQNAVTVLRYSLIVLHPVIAINERHAFAFMSKSAFSGMKKYLHDHGIIDHRSSSRISSTSHHPLSSPLLFGEIFRSRSDTWHLNREHSFPYKGSIVGYRYRRLWHVHPLDFLTGNMSRMRII